MPQPQQISEQLLQLSRLLVEEDDLDGTLQRVADLSTTLVGACDSCGVSLLTEGRLATRAVGTRAASDARADRVDELQYASGVGPCLEAIETGQAVVAPSFATEERWEVFIDRAMREGIRASYSIPLRIGEEIVGSLNLYSCDDPFEEVDQTLADLLATQAAVALRNAQTYHQVLELVSQLHEAVDSRDVIGQAKGVLMARFGLDADEAFSRLRDESQRRNVKLRELAADIAADAAAGPRPD